MLAEPIAVTTLVVEALDALGVNDLLERALDEVGYGSE